MGAKNGGEKIMPPCVVGFLSVTSANGDHIVHGEDINKDTAPLPPSRNVLSLPRGHKPTPERKESCNAGGVTPLWAPEEYPSCACRLKSVQERSVHQCVPRTTAQKETNKMQL